MGEADLDTVVEIERGWAPTPWSRSQFRNELAIPFSSAVVLCDGAGAGRVVAYRVRWSVADEIHLLSLAVAEPFRRHGAGGRLLDDLLDEASARRAAVVTLEVEASNRAARALYGSRGFCDVRCRRNYYGNGRDAVVMEWRPGCRDVS